MLLYDVLLDDSGFPEQDRQLLMTSDSVILAGNLLDYCTNIGVFATKFQNKHFKMFNSLGIKAVSDITPLFVSLFVEFNWKDQPDTFEGFPLKYGVHIWTVENKDEIRNAFEINKELFRQCNFDLDKQCSL